MKKLLLASCILISPSLCAEVSDTLSGQGGSAVGIVESDGLKFLRGAGYILSAPARWSGSDWMTFGAAGVGTAAMSTLDIDGRDLMQARQTPGRSDLANAAQQYGSGVNMIALSAGGTSRDLHSMTLAAGNLFPCRFRDPHGRSGVHRHQDRRREGAPLMNRGHMTFKPFTFPVENYLSFPSATQSSRSHSPAFWRSASGTRGRPSDCTASQPCAAFPGCTRTSTGSRTLSSGPSSPFP